MKRSTAVRHLVGLAESASRLAATQWRAAQAVRDLEAALDRESRQAV